MAVFKNFGKGLCALQKSVNSNLGQMNLVNIIPNCTKLTSNTVGIHTAAFCDGLKLLNSSYANCSTNLNSLNNGSLALSCNYIPVRHWRKKGKWAVGPTKSAPGGRGKFRGLKVYDGQRVPQGTCLVNQIRPVVFPGWNVSIATACTYTTKIINTLSFYYIFR